MRHIRDNGNRSYKEDVQQLTVCRTGNKICLDKRADCWLQKNQCWPRPAQYLWCHSGVREEHKVPRYSPHRACDPSGPATPVPWLREPSSACTFWDDKSGLCKSWAHYCYLFTQPPGHVHLPLHPWDHRYCGWPQPFLPRSDLQHQEQVY